MPGSVCLASGPGIRLAAGPALGTDFAQALGNVDRHKIQSRDDAKRYAFGILGLGSLLQTQLR